jgi:hypothetical protein
MAEYMYKPEEVLNMFSEALRILDSNTVRLMIDEMSEELEEQKEQLAEKDEKLAEKDEEIRRLREELATYKS